MDNTASSSGGDQEVLAFNLTDPERLTTQLDAANLDDEETELLLEEALKLNARLKDVLRHQQLETHEPSSSSSSGSKGRGSGGRGRSTGSGPGRPSHPLEEQFIRKQPPAPGGKARLPPIGATGARPKQGKGARSDDVAHGGPRPGSSRRRQGSGKKRPVDNRPAWDDRFSYD